MRKLFGLLLLISLPLIVWAQEDDQELTEEQSQVLLQQFLDSLHRQTGTIELPNGIATLNVPEQFYYLNQEDADKVLTKLWGNPEGEPTLGMLFPADMSPADDNAWAVTIEYEEEGYVKDNDADKINYNDLLKQMKEDIYGRSR